MNKTKRKLIGEIECQSRRKAGRFARLLVKGKSEEKEAVLAGMQFEKWLADTCLECLDYAVNVKIGK